MRKGLIAASLGLLAAAVLVTSALAKSEATATSAQLAACTNVSLGFVGPLTGPVAFLGQEQISWLRFGVQKYNRANKTRFKVSGGDTQLKAPVARTVARRFVADRKIMAIIGPSESQAVRVGGNLYEKAGLAAISGSATATDLTKGRPYTTFFRVVPNDAIQGPQVVAFVAGNLGAKNVVVIDSQDDYSIPLASGIARGLRARNVTVSRESVSVDDTDFSSIVANVDNNVNVVVFATQNATAANTLSNQLREQGKKAVVFGTDGAYSPAQYKPRLGYVSVFAPDLHFDPKAKALIREYNRYSKNRTFGSFGPATYMAGLAAMDAIARACADGTASRSEVTRLVRSTNLPSIFGGTLRFSKKGDPLPTKFILYKITNGIYSPVG
ncbi:MAG: branched-chain amino acid ABC transporter substrate-binding protein [Actinomycetota bacterium]|nr:branched-chain amino acid ABC transporter substrate-binding protein [Actinomycetota bacterium]